MVSINVNSVEVSTFYCLCNGYLFNSADIEYQMHYVANDITTTIVRFIAPRKSKKRMDIEHCGRVAFCNKCENYLGRIIILPTQTMISFHNGHIKEKVHSLFMQKEPKRNQ